LDPCGYLYAAARRPAEAVTIWVADDALGQQTGDADQCAWVRLRYQPLRAARQALGPTRARAAEERGATMSPAAAAEDALLLTEDRGASQAPAAPGLGKLSAREQELVTLVARAPTPRSPPSCSSASAPSPRT
jgi:hypothetical protein